MKALGTETDFFRRISKKKFKKVLTNRGLGAIIGTNLNITKNDCDEEGRKAVLTESCRVVQDNGRAIRMTYHF